MSGSVTHFESVSDRPPFLKTHTSILISDFDPAKLTVAQLRGFLLDKDVEYPSNAKKADLLRIYHERVAKPETIEISDVDSPTVKEKKKKHKSRRKARGLEPKDETEEAETSKELTLQKTETLAKAEGEPSEKLPKGRPKKTKRVKSGEPVGDAGPEKPGPPETKEEISEKSQLEEAGKLEEPEKVETPAKKTKPLPKTTKSATASPALPQPKLTLTSPSSVQKKRKARDEPDSRTPTKGNVFEVEYDAVEPLPKKKQKKISSRAKSPVPKTPKAQNAPAEPLTTPSVPVASGTIYKFASNSPEVTHTPDTRFAHKIETPVLRQISDFPDSPPETSFVSSAANDTSHSFDNALRKMKKDVEPKPGVKEVKKDAELARLLGIDVNGVKPKLKSRRSITPRRAIIIQESDLSRNDDLSIEELSDEEIAEEIKLVEQDLENEEKKSEEDILEKEEGLEHENVSLQISLRSIFKVLSYFLIWISLAGFSLFGYWHREQTILVGYCGQSIQKETIPETPETPAFLVQFGNYLDSHFKPDCVECPQHARCFPRLEMACYDDFVLSRPSYFSYWPNANMQRCVPDSKKAEKIEIMIDVALDLLRARNANVDCGRTSEDDTSAGIEVSELHDLLLALKAAYITEEEFEEVWARSVKELEKEPEIIVRQVINSFDIQKVSTNTQVGFTSDNIRAPSDTNNTAAAAHIEGKILRSTSLSHLSVKCMMSNTMVRLLVRFKTTMAVSLAMLLAACLAYYRYERYKLHARKLDTIYREVLSKLQRQAKLARNSPEIPPHIGLIQLRDLILNESNLAYKMRLWEAVSHKVDRNTNVKHELIEVHGEVMKMWQWISHLE